MLSDGLQQSFVPRLSAQARDELALFQQALSGITLGPAPDKRITPFSKGDWGLDSGALYNLLKARGQPEDPRAVFIWHNSAPPRVQLFMWLLLHRRIQCRTVVLTKHIVQDAICEICHEAEENPDHIIKGCTLGRQIWQLLNCPSVLSTEITSFYAISPTGGVPPHDFSAFIALVCWQLWKARNAAIFRQEFMNANQLLASCKATAEHWRARMKPSKRQIADAWCQLFEMARQGLGGS